MNELQFNIAQIKIELLIRQTLSYGQTITGNFEPVVANQIVGSLVKDTCEIIMSTVKRNEVLHPVDQPLLDRVNTAWCDELNNLYHGLNMLQGLPLPLLETKYQLRIKDAAITMAMALKTIVSEEVKSIFSL